MSASMRLGQRPPADDRHGYSVRVTFVLRWRYLGDGFEVVRVRLSLHHGALLLSSLKLQTGLTLFDLTPSWRIHEDPSRKLSFIDLPCNGPLATSHISKVLRHSKDAKRPPSQRRVTKMQLQHSCTSAHKTTLFHEHAFLSYSHALDAMLDLFVCLGGVLYHRSHLLTQMHGHSALFPPPHQQLHLNAFRKMKHAHLSVCMHEYWYFDLANVSCRCYAHYAGEVVPLDKSPVET